MTLEAFLSSKKLVFFLLLLVTLAAFGNTFQNEWTYDDIPVVLENPDVRSLDNFKKDAYKSRPLRELSYMLDYQLFGTEPAGYRIQQLLWHAANGFLLLLVMMMLGVAPIYALLGASLFLVHPFQTETVASIGHRKELLPLFFGLLLLLTYAKSFTVSGAQRWLLWGSCLACYILVLLGNITAGTLPLLLPVYEQLFVERRQRILARYPLLCFGGVLVAVVGCVYYYFDTFNFQQALLKTYVQNGFVGEQGYLPMFWVVFKVPLLYLGKLLWPFSLAPEYVVRFSAASFQWAGFLGILMVIVVAALAFLWRRKSPVLSFAIAWCLTLYIPVSNLLPVYAYPMADRYMYLVLPGVAMAAAFLLQRINVTVVTQLFVVVLIGLSVLTVLQNNHWRNESSLWAHAVAVNPESKGALWSMAITSLEEGKQTQAKEGFKKVLELDRFYVRAYLELAKIQEREGDLQAARKNYELFARYGRFQFPKEAQRINSYLKFRFQ